MIVYKYSVVLDESGKNILVRDSAGEYPCLDRLDSVTGVAQLMRDVFELHSRAEEYVYLICLTTGGFPIGFFEVSHGTCNMALANPREVLIRALLCGAASILLVHNHPGGNASPSRMDDDVTGAMREAAALIGIGLCDHIIIGGWSHYSYRAAGKLTQNIGCMQFFYDEMPLPVPGAQANGQKDGRDGGDMEAPS